MTETLPKNNGGSTEEVRHSRDASLPVAIVGGGISGLALAVWLRREGRNVLVMERSAAPGGVIGTIEKNGFTFERGPNTALDRHESFDELIELANLEAETQRSPLKNQERYIWHDGKLHEVPTGPADFIGTQLFSFGAKLRAMREPWIAPVAEDEPLKDFITRRLGAEIYERAFEPMTNGIWASDPAMMSTAASFPALKEYERNHGSIIRGFIAKMKAAKAERAAGRPPRAPQMVSFQGGLARLPRALAESLGDAYLASTTVKKIEKVRDGGPFRLMVDFNNQTIIIPAASVVIAAEATGAASLIEPFDAPLAARLRAINYAPLAVVGLGVSRNSLRLPPGFGFLTAREPNANAGLRVLGVIFNSNFLPGRALEGSAVLTAMFGGDRDPEAASLPDSALIDLVKKDLAAALNWNGELVTHQVERWPRAIPRYGLDYFELESAIEDFERQNVGIRLFGNWRGATSLGDRIDLARKLAKQITAEVLA